MTKKSKIITKLSIFSLIGIVITTPILLNLNKFEQKTKHKKLNQETGFFSNEEKKDIEQKLFNYIDTALQQQLTKLSHSSNSKQIVFNKSKIKEFSAKFLYNNFFKNSNVEKNLNIQNELVSFLRQENILNEKIKLQINRILPKELYEGNASNSQGDTKSSGDPVVSEIFKNFEKAAKDSFIVGGVAAAAAAGFWAASFFTGGTTSAFAIAATSASISALAQGAIFQTAANWMKGIDNKYLALTLKQLKGNYDFYGYYKLIENIKKVKTAAKALKIVRMTTSWAVPIVEILASSLEFILDKMDY